MAGYSEKMSDLLLTYSLSHEMALGVNYLKEAKSEFYVPRINFLLQRWNYEDSQANIYLSLGTGYEKFENKNYSVNLGELVLDWETRKYYTYFQQTYLNRQNNQNSLLANLNYSRSKLRLGVAPYLADFKDLSSWVIAQIDTNTLNTNEVEMSQFLRFYYRNVLWEIGSNLDGKIKFNFMIHY